VVVDEPIVRVLPRHAHNLSRGTVNASQRGRLLEAIVEVAARVGYADASVALVVERAGVSRKAFYEHFTDKQECFLDAYEVVSDRLIATLAAIPEHAQIERFLEVLDADLATARVLLVDVLGAGPDALRARELVNRRFGDVIFRAVRDPVRRVALVGGINAVVVEALIAAKRPILRDLAPALTAFVGAATKNLLPKRRPGSKKH
jgi:AcrR family transcriptional regulator